MVCFVYPSNHVHVILIDIISELKKAHVIYVIKLVFLA